MNDIFVSSLLQYQSALFFLHTLESVLMKNVFLQHPNVYLLKCDFCMKPMPSLYVMEGSWKIVAETTDKNNVIYVSWLI